MTLLVQNFDTRIVAKSQ